MTRIGIVFWKRLQTIKGCPWNHMLFRSHSSSTLLTDVESESIKGNLIPEKIY